MKTEEFFVSNGRVSFSAIDYGCIITQINVPGKNGTKNIVYSLKNFDDYVKNPKYYGAIVGRVANRIKDASFSLGGENFALDKNENENCLHGGFNSYSDMHYSAKSYKTKEKSGIIFERLSPDGEQGFPGNLNIRIEYSLENEKSIAHENDTNENITDENIKTFASNLDFVPNFYSIFSIEIIATTDKTTPVNIINHSYFNLAGFSDAKMAESSVKNPSIENQIIMLNADSVLEVDKQNLPTGKILSAKECRSDLKTPISFGEAMKKRGKIFDTCFILNKNATEDDAKIIDNENMRAMLIKTNQKAAQLYTPETNDCFALETQGYVDAVNHSEFPSILLKPVKKYTSKTQYILFYS